MVLLKKTHYDAKITEIEGKIPNVTNLATKTELNEIDGKILNITGLISKGDIMIRTLTKLRPIMRLILF